MRRLGSIAFVLLMAALLAPEFPRYAAERRVGFATAVFQSLLEKSGEPETSRRILAVGELALSTTAALPGDSRPWMLAASSYLVTGQPERALEYYRSAFSTGERAEIDLNLGRAYSFLARKESADAAFLRAGWVNPEILGALPEELKGPLLGRIEQLAEQLRKGRLDAPPPLPPEERR